MIKLENTLSVRALRYEWIIATALVWLALIAVPVTLGGMSLGWDALNHHIYLGWNAENQRLDQDYLAAGVQAFQFPYTYWPAYRLASEGASGIEAGLILNSIHATAAPAIWLIGKYCIPGQTFFDAMMRVLGTLLAFTSAVVVSLLDTTNNDILAAIPLIWAISIAMWPCHFTKFSSRTTFLTVTFSGLLTGAAVAFKLSNGPLAILLPGLWWFGARSFPTKMLLTFIGCVATLAGFALIYGYWGILLWSHFGNPIHPFYDGLFEPIRRLTGWTP